MAADGEHFADRDWYEAVYEAVRLVPKGKVATYGQIAASVTSYSLTARQVGAAMRYAPEGVPWQRIVGAGGRLPIASRSPELMLMQRRLLEEEGVPFLGEDTNRINMEAVKYA